MWPEMLSDYLRQIEQTVNNLDNVQIEQYREERISPTDAVLRIRIRFSNRYLLELNEAVYLEDGQIRHRKYRYHFQDAKNVLVFRYDSAPHFPDLRTFPHHKLHPTPSPHRKSLL